MRRSLLVRAAGFALALGAFAACSSSDPVGAGPVQQVVQVSVRSEWNLLIVGALLVVFVTVAPNGIMGWVSAWRRRRRA